MIFSDNRSNFWTLGNINNTCDKVNKQDFNYMFSRTLFKITNSMQAKWNILTVNGKLCVDECWCSALHVDTNGNKRQNKVKN